MREERFIKKEEKKGEGGRQRKCECERLCVACVRACYACDAWSRCFNSVHKIITSGGIKKDRK